MELEGYRLEDIWPTNQISEEYRDPKYSDWWHITWKLRYHRLGERYECVSNVCEIDKDNPPKFKFLCKTHGEFSEYPAEFLRGKGCPQCLPKIRNTTDFIARAKMKLGDKFDYGPSVYVDSKTKIDVACRKHGIFSVFVHNHLSGYNCPKCRIENITSNTEEYIAKARKIHGDTYDYSKLRYIEAKKKVEIICRKPDHGSFWKIAAGHLNGQGCPKCTSSFGETAIRTILLKHKVDHVEQYNLPEVQTRYRYDFYIPHKRLLIEFHGDQHYRHLQNQKGVRQSR